MCTHLYPLKATHFNCLSLSVWIVDIVLEKKKKERYSAFYRSTCRRCSFRFHFVTNQGFASESFAKTRWDQTLIREQTHRGHILTQRPLSCGVFVSDWKGSEKTDCDDERARGKWERQCLLRRGSELTFCETHGCAQERGDR